ncbi:MAG TPA: methylated-DNA--[protein]-cysteine S-methyltransferase [Gammaproteobacteria bacterium]|nr:methylated-DNA--[protein]-cysteine S-methyltransferase [Gammaproteobacteria bacterium]
MQDGVLLKIDFLAQPLRPASKNKQQFQKLTNQLQQYFKNPQTDFNIKSDERGTVFQRRVWQALRCIPVGETRTYGQIAKQLSSSPRAVGGACRANPLPIITPCHRVTAANGTGGFAGARQGKLLEIKEWLLEHEAG